LGALAGAERFDVRAAFGGTGLGRSFVHEPQDRRDAADFARIFLLWRADGLLPIVRPCCTDSSCPSPPCSSPPPLPRRRRRSTSCSKPSWARSSSPSRPSARRSP